MSDYGYPENDEERCPACSSRVPQFCNCGIVSPLHHKPETDCCAHPFHDGEPGELFPPPTDDEYEPMF